MRQEVFKLSSGAKLEMRQVMVSEENYLAGIAKKGGSVERGLLDVLTKCTIGVVDTGPYVFLEVGGKPDWDRMIRGDMFSALIQVRAITYREGEKLEFEKRCPGAGCGKRFTWEIDLFEDLTWTDLPEESMDKLKTGEPFEVTIDERKVKYTLAFGKTERTYSLLSEQHQDRDMSCGLRSRIVSVEGVEPQHLMDWLDGNNYDPSCQYKGLTSQDGDDLREAFDVVEGGVDTAVEIQCPKCNAWFDVNVPFTGFFLPGKGINTRKRKAREAKRLAMQEKKLLS